MIRSEIAEAANADWLCSVDVYCVFPLAVVLLLVYSINFASCLSDNAYMNLSFFHNVSLSRCSNIFRVSNNVYAVSIHSSLNICSSEI